MVNLSTATHLFQFSGVSFCLFELGKPVLQVDYDYVQIRLSNMVMRAMLCINFSAPAGEVTFYKHLFLYRQKRICATSEA